jgi:hypothetical protein
MVSTILTVFVVIAASTPQVNCPISGSAELWAYDACMWEKETDDANQAEVLSCVSAAKTLIAKVGECQAKRHFKVSICAALPAQERSSPAAQACKVGADLPLGPAVRSGGL